VRRPALLPTAALALALLTPKPAVACWDGLLLAHDSTTIQIDVGSRWYVDVESAADWMVRFDALLSADAELEIVFGSIFITDASGTCSEAEIVEEADDFEEAFALVARACGRSKADVAAARKLEGDLFTVQLLSTSDRAKAESTIEHLEGNMCSWSGFYTEGAFPGITTCAELETVVLADGREVHRVLVGNFLDRASAELVRAEIDDELGVGSMVRAK
jgi:hypothetical protein